MNEYLEIVLNNKKKCLDPVSLTLNCQKEPSLLIGPVLNAHTLQLPSIYYEARAWWMNQV